MVSEYNLTRIWLEQLQENGIIYFNNTCIMTLIKDDKTIVNNKKSHNLFTLNSIIPSFIISTIIKEITAIN